MVAVRLAALVSDEKRIRGVYARCAIQIDNMIRVRNRVRVKDKVKVKVRARLRLRVSQ